MKRFNPSTFDSHVLNPEHDENSLCFILGARKSFETGYIHPHKHYLLPLEPACYVPVNQEFLKDVIGVPLWVRGVEPGGQRREQGSTSRFSAPC